MSKSTEPGEPTEPEVASEDRDADPHAPTMGAAADDAQTVPPTWWDDARDSPRQPSNPFQLTEVSPQRYEILGEHGRGGLGRVLRARDRRTGRLVALKEGLRDTPHAVRRFEREALVTANLQHPTIVPVYEVGRWPDGHPFYAMKLVEGMTLSAAIRAADTASGRLALLPHVIHVADGLAYAHARGWIHRDLKPSNVLVGSFGETVVIDWGLAKRIDGTDESSDVSMPLTPDGATLDGQILGTPAYMAPEQARGERVDTRSDVYAIGALMYQVLAGVTPYHEGADSAAVLALVIGGPPRPLAELAPDLPTELYTIVARAMAYRADERYPSARELADDLARFRAGNLVTAHAYSPWELVRRWLRRHRTAVAVAALAAITLVVVGAVSYRENSRARRRAEAEGVLARAARVESDARRREAEARVVALHTELGLRELSAGSPARALPYLADAYRKDPDDPVVGFLVSRGLASLTPLELAFDTDVVYALGFGGGRLVPSTSGRTPVIELESRRTVVEIRSPAGVISFDGRVVATRIEDHTIAIHDAASGAELARRDLGSAAGEVRWVAFEGAGRVVAATAAGVVHVLHSDLTPVTTARIPFAPDGVVVSAAGRVLAGGPGGELWSWDLASGRESPLPRVHRSRVSALCASPDGRRWMSIDRAEIVVWDDQRVVARAAHNGRPAGCVIDVAGRRAVTSIDGHGVDLWELAAVAPAPVSLRDGRGAPPNYSDVVALSSDGARVAIADSRGHVEIIAAADRRILSHFVGHDAPIATAAFAPDGARLATATVAGDVRVWRANATSDVIAIDLGARSSAAAFVDDASVVAVGTQGARVVATSDGRTLAELIGHTEGASHVDVDRTRGRIVTASRDGTARLWRGDGTPIATLAGGGGWVRRVGFSASGERVLTATIEGGLALWRAGDGGLERRIPVLSPLFAARLSPDGRRAVATREGSAEITLVDTERGTVVASLSPMGQQAVDARWSPDGDLLALPTVTMLMAVVDGRTGERRFDVEHEAPVMAAAWSGDGATLVSTDLAGVIRVTGRDGARLRTLKTTTGIAALALHPGGHLVAVTTQDAVVRILELSTGRELATLSMRDFPVVLAFSPSGDHLVIAGNDDVARLWNLAPYRGTADALSRRLRCAVPFRLDDAHGLAAASVDPGSC